MVAGGSEGNSDSWSIFEMDSFMLARAVRRPAASQRPADLFPLRANWTLFPPVGPQESFARCFRNYMATQAHNNRLGCRQRAHAPEGGTHTPLGGLINNKIYISSIVAAPADRVAEGEILGLMVRRAPLP